MLKRVSSAERKSWLAGAALVAGIVSLVAASPLEPNLVSGLRWRMIGPFRGGRIAAVTGVIGQPGTFYIGLPLGGVWKTTSAGATWYPIMDGVKEASSVGSVQVAPSDPNVIYAGMGDLITGGGINEGNGMYKSVDAGKTWQHLGLDETKQIPSILVDPKDPNLVLIAAQGNVHKKMDMRGVFRSTDGGKNWTKTLYVDDEAGGQEIAWAFDNPKVMLATTVQHYTDPLAGRGGGAGGGGAQGASRTKLFKSLDEGITWKEISGNGLPALTGRTSIAVAMNSNSRRMYLIGNFGLYRSDNGGDTWRQMAAGDRRIANGQNGYNCGVYVDPTNPDVVYTINTSSFKSVDGGNSFTGFKGAPGGDDPQQMWIDPTDGHRMLLGVDQGATVSLDGGLTWSSWYNQATEQVYHISTDNSFPYWVYATQQDAGAIATRSRGNLGTVNWMDWLPVPGYEFGYIVADPLNPKIVYSGGPSAGVVKITYPSEQWINISPNIDTSLALRKVGNQPMAFSPTNPHELLLGFQYLMSTTDGGAHWKKLSPDLGYPKGVTPPERSPARVGRRGAAAPAAAPGTPAAQNAPPVGGSIESFSSSSVAAGVIWVGTNNGLIKVTKDHGLTWTDVTIPDLPNPTRADISTIDASHHDAAEAYVAIDYHGVGDYTPYFYRTKDYGKTWTKIVSGVATDQPSGSFARVIRADTKRAGLLFAGTESSMYVSFNDGDDWQSLMLNLPNTSYRDIQIKDNDLVVGTYGRSFWILDDISPLRQMNATIATEKAHLFKPGDAYRIRRDVNGDTPFPPEVPHGENPPPGALIYYWLASKPAGDITLEISDATGRVVRHMSSVPPAPIADTLQAIPEFWKEVIRPIPTAPGTNRINWNIRYDNPPTFTHSYAQMMGAVEGETPWSPEGPLAPPGLYTVKLTVEGKSYTQTVMVKNDPRSPATTADLTAQHELLTKLYDASREAWDGYTQVTAMRSALGELSGSNPPAEAASAISAFAAKVAAVGGSGAAGGRGGGGGGRGAAAGPPPVPNFAGLVGALNRQLDGLDFGDLAPTEPMVRAWGYGCSDLRSAVNSWRSINAGDLVALNQILAKNGLRAVKGPATSLALPVCTAAAGGKHSNE